jgi:hypothetical protein
LLTRYLDTQTCLDEYARQTDGVTTMIGLRPLIAAAALAIAGSATLCGSAFGFQEQNAAVAPKAAPTANAGAKDAEPTAAADGVSSNGGKGTAVRIPGLGTLGVIPKMDFGLELLYGVADAGSATKRPEPKNEGEDVLLRGAIKHKF